MQIDVKGRNVPVTDELRDHVIKRFANIGKQTPESTRLEIEFTLEQNPAIADAHIVDATIYLKGTTLRASDRAWDPEHAMNLCAHELTRQVKRDRDKRRRRREARVPGIAASSSQVDQASASI
jgi:putative sigma-54 modulation protein